MKKLALLITAFVNTAAFAADFDSQLSKIHSQSARIQARLRGLGIQTNDTDSGSIFSDPNAKKIKPMFEVHGDAKTREAEEGRFIFGHLVNRLVVSGENHPVIVKIDQDQGIFSGLKHGYGSSGRKSRARSG